MGIGQVEVPPSFLFLLTQLLFSSKHSLDCFKSWVNFQSSEKNDADICQCSRCSTIFSVSLNPCPFNVITDMVGSHLPSCYLFL